jgi:hypothetical protein
MYKVMTDYILENIDEETTINVQCGCYASNRLEEEAVDAYYNLPTLRKFELHTEMTVQLAMEKHYLSEKLVACRNLLLGGDEGVKIDNPIFPEYQAWLQTEYEKWEERCRGIEADIDLEQTWWYEAEEPQEQYDPNEV